MRDVGVVGAGFAGSAAALFLARAGFQVTVYEAVPRPGPVGAGILLQPTGLYVLEQLGLAERLLERAAVVDALRARTAGGREIFHLRYQRVREDLFGLGLHRGVLFQLLFDSACAEPRVDVRCGVRVVAVDERARLIDDEGRAHGPHDLVVVADGSLSELRTSDAPVAMDAPYPWGALWIVTPDPGIFSRELYQVVEGTKTMLGFLPTGRAPGSSTELISMFWSIRVAAVADWRQRARTRGLHRFKDRVRRLEPRAEALLGHIDDVDQLLFATYRDVRMRRWHFVRHRTPLVFIGDAAHAMSPQLGQGSNLALYDAMELGRCLGDDDDMLRALRRYDGVRGDHLRYYQAANRMLTPFFQSSSTTLGLMRDAFFPLLTVVPYLHDAAVETLAGVRRGFLWGDPLPLPSPRPRAAFGARNARVTAS